MNTPLRELVTRLELERLEQNLFRGPSKDLGWGRVYGGQVLGQALAAASQTVPDDRPVHSLHAYFLLAGDVNAPIIYDVDRIRDGGSFTTRRVVAIQHGRPILNLAASFQKVEASFDHQDEMPEVPGPEALEDDRERYRAYGDRLPSFLRDAIAQETPFETRTIDALSDPIQPEPQPPRRHYWMRAAGNLPDAPWLHCALLAYASDNNFVVTALQPHGVTWLTPGVMVASLDHTMWFHRPFRMDEWLLYSIDSPSASGSRGFARGRIFDQGGRLIASTAQEGLTRRTNKAP